MAQRQSNVHEHDSSITDRRLRIGVIRCEGDWQTLRNFRDNERFAANAGRKNFALRCAEFTRRANDGSIGTHGMSHALAFVVSGGLGTAHQKTFSTYVPLNAVAS